MTKGEIFFVAGFLILQGFFIILCFSSRVLKVIHRTRLRQVSAFLGAQAFCVFLLLFGGYAETRVQFYNILRASVGKRSVLPSENFTVNGDPALTQWVQNQRPDLPRPDFRSAEALRKWQTSLRLTLLTKVFRLPDIASPVNVRVHKRSSITDQSITRSFLVFESFDGTSIPAYLFIPPLPAPRPAILVLHGHVGEQEQGISQTAGIVDSYQHKVALELAKAGYVTLTLEFRGFGYLGQAINEHAVAYNAILGGTFYKAILCKDIKYAFDFLQSLREVNSERIGITGVSFGGEMAATYAALDERIKVIVFQGFGGTIGVQQGVVSTGQEQPHYCHIIPGHNLIFFREDLFLLLAPRPLLGVRGNQDYNVKESKNFFETIGAAYNCFGVSPLFKFETADGGHEYFIQPAIQFFKYHL